MPLLFKKESMLPSVFLAKNATKDFAKPIPEIIQFAFHNILSLHIRHTKETLSRIRHQLVKK